MIGPKAKTAWAKQIDQLIAVATDISIHPDPYAEGLICDAIEWLLDPCRVDDQYTPVVRSGRALREKWPQIVAAMNRRSPAETAEVEKQQQRAALQEKYG